MNSLPPSGTFNDQRLLEELPSLEAIEAEIRQREAKQNAEAIRASQIGRGGLLRFVEYFWPILEPQTVFVDGWPLHAICAHLEAVTFGEINRLLINVPPGFMKSLLTEVFWPAWEHGPMDMPHLRYVTFSYSASLTERDNRRFKDLIVSPEYQLLWGDRFALRKQGETLVSNNKTGWKLASSVGGVGTGERGDRVMCVRGDTQVETEHGKLSISQVVAARNSLFVLGFDHRKNAPRWQRIVAYESNPARPLVRVRFDQGEVVCTADHPVYIVGRGYTEAQAVRKGETALFVDTVCDLRQCLPSTHGDVQSRLQAGTPEEAGATAEHAAMRGLRDSDLSHAIPLGEAQGKSDLQSQMLRRLKRWRRQSNVARWLGRSSLSALRQVLHIKAGPRSRAYPLLHALCNAGALGTYWAIRIKARAANVVRRMWIAVDQAASQNTLLLQGVCGSGTCQKDARNWQWPLRPWSASETIRSWLDAKAQEGGERAGRLLLPLVRNDGSRARHGAARSPYQLRQGRYGLGQSDFAVPNLPRCDARRSGFPQGVDEKVICSVEPIDGTEPTFNLRVEPDHNYFANGILTHNCDDPHNVKEAESDQVRGDTVRWFQEAAENRLNDLKKSAIVVIMQRVHELDVAGSIIKGGGYTHLMIPWEFEPSRACKTSIGWKDPRKEDGEPAWSARFGEKEMLTFKRRAYMFAGQYQQRPEPRGGGIFKRGWWKNWNDVTAATFNVKPGYLPSFSYVLGILDTAYTEKEENDPCAMTIWGLFTDAKGNPNVMLVNAWEEWLEFNPLVEKTAKVAKDFKIDRLLIESKASGISVAQELSRRYSQSGFAIELQDPGKHDKVARAYAVTSFWEDGLVWAPGTCDAQGNPTGWRKFAERVVDQMATFPKSTHKDLTDTATMGLKYLRDLGLLLRQEEHARNVTEALTFRGRQRPLYNG